LQQHSSSSVAISFTYVGLAFDLFQLCGCAALNT
jgi:hypothetical protein